MFNKMVIPTGSGGETVNYDFTSQQIVPLGTITFDIDDGMVTIAPSGYWVSQFEGTWYVKNGEMTKVFQNPNPKTSVSYQNGQMTVTNLTTGYAIDVWIYSKQ